MGSLVYFFNLIAILVEKARQFPEYRRTQHLSDSDAERVKDCVDGLMHICFKPSIEDTEKRLSITQDDIDNILDRLKDKNFYYFRALITRLDKLLSPESLYNLLKPKALSGQDVTERYFSSLNDNAEQTGIYIFPNISTVNTETHKKDFFSGCKARLENDLKEQLKSIYYVEKEALKDFKINNVVLDCKLNDKNYITIAVTPLCNTAQGDLIEISHFEAQHNGVGIKLLTTKLRDPRKSNDTFKKVLNKCSDEGDVDIVMGPEILGTEEYSSVNCMGYNEEIRTMCKSPPSLIIPPTYVHDSANVLSVFSDSGEKLGEQHKQEPFDDKKSKEDLRNAKREILVLHIFGIGRVCFLICKDFLMTEYSDILINELKANLLLCPSYSGGVRRFDASKRIATGHNCRVVWINCCSAFANRTAKGAFIGFAAGNYIPDTTAYLQCSESSECKSCYYKIKIPLFAGSGGVYDDNKIEVQHKRI